jgi:hypothetical protein
MGDPTRAGWRRRAARAAARIAWVRSGKSSCFEMPSWRRILN